ncbi:hypothetical protein K3495_g8185 [Podosphaera aphanis]|nr:hypothetical protein K3495_g8185 [Podosphaera aphanis]
MPLLNIMGQTCLGTSFNIGSCFLSGETQADYEWALKTGLQSLFIMLHLSSPVVWVTDREIALIRAIQSLHSGTSIVLCVWHINMDVRGYASKLLMQTELVKDLIKDWENVVYRNTDINYMDNWKKFEDRYTLSENHNHANPFLESESGIPESHIDAATAYQNPWKSYE